MNRSFTCWWTWFIKSWTTSSFFRRSQQWSLWAKTILSFEMDKNCIACSLKLGPSFSARFCNDSISLLNFHASVANIKLCVCKYHEKQLTWTRTPANSRSIRIVFVPIACPSHLWHLVLFIKCTNTNASQWLWYSS